MKLEWRDVPIGDGPAISTSLTADETAELQRLAKDADVLEVGSAYGYSTVAMGLVARSVVAVDPHQWLNSFGVLLENLEAYGVTSRCVVDMRREDSRVVLPVLAGEGRTFDLIWIDGDHQAHVVAQDVANALRLLKPTGTLACHDYDEATCPGVREALDAWKVPPRLVDTMAVYGPGEW
jgi:predicted O-methyltransferase YrrM